LSERARPARVGMRARNPCVRLRLMALGWKVRFMTTARRRAVKLKRGL